jgi:aspartate/methionine/tyrosine aminotransferase
MTESVLGRAIAQRVLNLPASGESPPDGTIDLSGAMLSGSTSESIRTAVMEDIAKHRCDHYTRRPGIAPLCHAIADGLAQNGVNGDANNGVIVAGNPSEARYVAARTLGVDHQVFLLGPATEDFSAGLSFAGADVEVIDVEVIDPTEPFPPTENGLLIVVNPNPATGQLVDSDILNRLVNWVEETDSLVIADEIAAPLLSPDLSFQHFAALPGMAERTLTLGSFADLPGLNGWQVSWFAGPTPLATKVRDLKQAMTICSPAPGQYAALAGLDEHAADAVLQNVERLETLLSLLERFGLPYRKPDTTAFVVADAARFGGGDVVVNACADHGLRIDGGNTLGDANAIRIAATGPAFTTGLERLATALTELSTTLDG